MSIDSHFIDEETKAWRGEQSASEHRARKFSGQSSKQAVRPRIHILNHRTILYLPSGEHKFIFGWRDHQDREKPRGLEFRKKIEAVT